MSATFNTDLFAKYFQPIAEIKTYQRDLYRFFVPAAAAAVVEAEEEEEEKKKNNNDNDNDNNDDDDNWFSQASDTHTGPRTQAPPHRNTHTAQVTVVPPTIFVGTRRFPVTVHYLETLTEAEVFRTRVDNSPAAAAKQKHHPHHVLARAPAQWQETDTSAQWQETDTSVELVTPMPPPFGEMALQRLAVETSRLDNQTDKVFFFFFFFFFFPFFSFLVGFFVCL